MEHLSLQDPPSGGQQQGPPPALGSMAAPPVPQLPPQMFTTAAQLLDLTDTNLVLQDTTERIFSTPTNPSDTPSQDPSDSSSAYLYTDIPRGLYLVRGENVLLLGEIDLDKDDHIPAPYVQGDVETVFALHKREGEERRRREKRGRRLLGEMGFEGDVGVEGL